MIFSPPASEDASPVVEGQTAPSTDPLPKSGEGDEVSRLLEVARTRARGMTKLYWQVPESGYADAYLPRDEFFQRLEDCLSSSDAKLRAAVIAAMKEKGFV